MQGPKILRVQVIQWKKTVTQLRGQHPHRNLEQWNWKTWGTYLTFATNGAEESAQVKSNATRAGKLKRRALWVQAPGRGISAWYNRTSKWRVALQGFTDDSRRLQWCRTLWTLRTRLDGTVPSLTMTRQSYMHGGKLPAIWLSGRGNGLSRAFWPYNRLAVTRTHRDLAPFAGHRWDRRDSLMIECLADNVMSCDRGA